MDDEIFELKMQGHCCSQIIMAMGLKRLEKDNPDLIAAMAGLCNGMWQGKTCGIYSASLCLLYLADAEAADRYNIGAFRDWFEDAFGNTECDALLDYNPMQKAEKCPAMLSASFLKLSELLDWE